MDTVTQYHLQPSTGGASKTELTGDLDLIADFDNGLDGTWVECTEAEYDAQVAANEQSMLDYLAAQAAAQHAEAQSVYDEIVGIHPISALALARQIEPDFTP